MNPSPKKTDFSTPNSPVFDGSMDERFAEARSYCRETVRKILRKYPYDVDDVIQNASIKAFVNLSKFRADAQFNTWFFGIAVNEALMHLRTSRRPIRNAESITDMESILRITSSVPNPEHQVLVKERSRILARMVKRLSPRCRRETLAVISEKEMDRPKNPQEKAAFHYAKNQLRRMCQMDFARGLFQAKETVECD